MSEQYCKKRPLIGVGVVVAKDNRVLLGKRKGAHGSGEWSCAGGHLEFAESVEACAKRELEEETGLKALSLCSGYWLVNVMENEKHYVTLCAFVRSFEGEVKLLEPHKCEKWQWFSFEALPFPLFSPLSSLITKIGIENLKSIVEEPLNMVST